MDCSGEEKAPSRPLSRSELLRRAGAVGAAAAVPAALTTDAALAESELAELRQMKALAPGEAATIGAVCERLIPSDATGPGAKEANVIRYIDRALAGDLAPFRGPYTQAVVALDGYAQSKHGAPFASLPADKQDAILTDMDLGRVPASAGFAPNAKAVFEMIRTHAVQGMFGDPMHGGNVNFVGWKLVRFPGPRLVISANDQKLDVVPRSSLKSTYSIPLFKPLARRL
jgi:gluconate 2-dehydrogenase gamma chain